MMSAGTKFCFGPKNSAAVTCANLWPDWILMITVTAQRIVMRLSDEHIMLQEMVPWPVFFSGWLLESPENELAICGCIQFEAQHKMRQVSQIWQTYQIW